MKLNKIEVSISKTLIDSVISHDKFVLINNVLQEYNGMKEEMLLYCYKWRQNTESKNPKVANTKN